MYKGNQSIVDEIEIHLLPSGDYCAPALQLKQMTTGTIIAMVISRISIPNAKPTTVIEILSFIPNVMTFSDNPLTLKLIIIFDCLKKKFIFSLSFN